MGVVMRRVQRWMAGVAVVVVAGGAALAVSLSRPSPAAQASGGQLSRQASHPEAQPQALAPAGAGKPSALSLVVMPHPDDEMEAWSQIENSPTNYKVFVYLTRGNGTSYCRNAAGLLGLNANLGEVDPRGTTKFSYPLSDAACAQLRMRSTVGFLNAMSTKDRSLPTNLRWVKSVKLPVAKAIVPSDGDNSVEVYDGGTYGRVLFFNVHDGRVSKANTDWVIRSVLANKATLGVPASLPVRTIVGPFANRSYGQCSTYPHPDHVAVHQSVYGTDFKVTGYQSAATCASDPEAVTHRNVTAASWANAFAINPVTQQRLGAFERHYGWLNGYRVGGWVDIPDADTQLLHGVDTKAPFMRSQSFWRRFGSQGSR